MAGDSENLGGEEDSGESHELINGSTAGDGGVKPRHLLGTTLIDMVELGHGCAGDCVACGAFDKNYEPKERKVCPITSEQLTENISQEIVDGRKGTRHRLVDLFRRYMTSGVDMEPLESDIFNDASEIINDLSEGKSRMVAITHGLRCVESEDEKSGKVRWKPRPDQLRRVERLSELMIADLVPLLVLSIDPAREKGLAGKEAKKIQTELKEMEKNDSAFMRIIRFQAQKQQHDDGLTNPSVEENEKQWAERLEKMKSGLLDSVRGKSQDKDVELNDGEKIIKKYLDLQGELKRSVVEANAQSYAATVCALRPAIEAGKQVAFSLQGDKNENSPVYVGMTFRILQRMYEILEKEHGVLGAELYKLVEGIDVQPPRYYTGSGRAKNLLEIYKDRDCTVIPYKPFVEGPFRADPLRINRGRIKSDGTFEIQLYRAGRTYNDTVEPKDNPWRPVDLRRQVFETIEVVEPQDFLERLNFRADPRYVDIPSDSVEEGEGDPIGNIYPLSCIEGEQRGAIVAKIRSYIESYADVDDDLTLISVIDMRQYIVDALIPSEELKNFDDNDNMGKESLGEKIVGMHLPVLGQDTELGAVEMGKVLAIKALLNEMGVRIKLVGDSDVDSIEDMRIQFKMGDSLLGGAKDGGDEVLTPLVESLGGTVDNDDFDEDNTPDTRPDSENPLRSS